ncbi:MAG: ribose 5-phosphate isomerase B [Tissierellia bacterium]|nr:ribose 5-phosphate isomerase B [Tissierellia bacterium]
MKIAIGCDHAGFKLKSIVLDELKKWGYEVEDFGTYSEESVDYPLYGKAVGEAVVSGKADFGIVICGSGIGISISANKVKGVRCALGHDLYTAEFSRRHNNANVLAMGGRVIGEGLAIAIVEKFLTTEFEGGRHQRRVEQIENN